MLTKLQINKDTGIELKCSCGNLFQVMKGDKRVTRGDPKTMKLYHQCADIEVWQGRGRLARYYIYEGKAENPSEQTIS